MTKAYPSRRKRLFNTFFITNRKVKQQRIATQWCSTLSKKLANWTDSSEMLGVLDYLEGKISLTGLALLAVNERSNSSNSIYHIENFSLYNRCKCGQCISFRRNYLP